MIRYTADRSGVSASPSTCPSRSPAPAEELPPMNVRVSVFFDGTGNNLFNTRSRMAGGSRTTDSYGNDYSNIAGLGMYIIPDDHPDDFNFHQIVYVEGIGTYHNSGDDIMGSAFGMDNRGVKDRVTSCISRLGSIINSLAANTNRTINMLKLDPFGFSRGAAAARHFIHRCFEGGGSLSELPLTTILRMYRLTVSDMKFPFVGLFDTVASFGADHDNDTTDLHLDSIGRGQVLYVMHIAAGDEHRLNFPLTNAASRAGGMEVFVPGVHSDVGGGYNNNGDASENRLVILDIHHSITSTDMSRIRQIQQLYRRDMERWIRLGWYEQSNFHIMSTYNPSDSRSFLTNCEPLSVTRTGISKAYCKVPLLLMATKARENGQLNFESDVSDRSIIGSDPLLGWVYDQIVANPGRTATQWQEAMDPQIRQIRRRYFHMSSHYTPTAGLIHPNVPCFFDGRTYSDDDEVILGGLRKRKIHPG